MLLYQLAFENIRAYIFRRSDPLYVDHFPKNENNNFCVIPK